MKSVSVAAPQKEISQAEKERLYTLAMTLRAITYTAAMQSHRIEFAIAHTSNPNLIRALSVFKQNQAAQVRSIKDKLPASLAEALAQDISSDDILALTTLMDELCSLEIVSEHESTLIKHIRAAKEPK